eukprot:2882336-Pyramimonas_sp.AAC.1
MDDSSTQEFPITVDAVTDADDTKTPWVLVMNYIHKGGDNGILLTDLGAASRTPLTGLPVLPTDGSRDFDTLQVKNDDGSINTNYPDGRTDANSWGHVSNDLFDKIAVALGSPTNMENGLEVRFVAKTNRHDRLMHFKTTGEVGAYFRYGYYPSGTSYNHTKTKDGWVPLDGHTTTLPETQVRGILNQGDAAMLYHTFYSHTAVGSSSIKIWHIGQVSNAAWEVDTYDGTTSTNADNTYHQIWVRANKADQSNTTSLSNLEIPQVIDITGTVFPSSAVNYANVYLYGTD